MPPSANCTTENLSELNGHWVFQFTLARTFLVLLLALLITSVLVTDVSAQAPGTPPPDGVLPSLPGANQSALPIKGFLFLDESRTPVLVPGLSFEELERLQNLEAGIDSRTQAYDLQSLDIRGSAAGGRAELEVVIRLAVETTEGKSLSIPLGMPNFHLLAPPDVSGLDEYRTGVASDGLGYVLIVKTERRRQVVIRMSVSARVEDGSIRSLDFQLPDVPSVVRIDTGQSNVSGEIVGRGDEVLQPTGEEFGPVGFVVESGGGSFTLRWGKLDRGSDTSSLLEVDNSRITVNWNTLQDQPLMLCQLIIRSMRGSVSEFKLRLPPGAVFLDTPTLGASGQVVDLVGPVSTPEGPVFDIKIPDQERQQRIDLNLDIQLAASKVTSRTPFEFQVPSVVGALRQRGEIQFRTSDDYRLRWRSRPWIQNILASASDDPGRSYLFRYDRANFSLPIWLASTQRQLRLSTVAEVSLHDSVALLEYKITPGGQTTEGMLLKIDLADWKLRSVENTESSSPLDITHSTPYYEIQLDSFQGSDFSPIRIVAERALPTEVDGGGSKMEIDWRLPRLVDIDDSMLMQSAVISIDDSGRKSMIVDLKSSQHIDRLGDDDSSTTTSRTQMMYRIIPPDADVHLVSKLIQRKPSISLAGDASIELQGNQLSVSLDWIVNSSLDLEGRLPIHMPRLNRDRLPDGGTELSVLNGIREEATNPELTVGNQVVPDSNAEVSSQFEAHPFDSDSWTVSINGRPAVLEQLSDDKYELISDQLASGSMSLRWKWNEPIDSNVGADHQVVVALPSPHHVDTTFRGAMRITFQGNAQTRLGLGTPANLDASALPLAQPKGLSTDDVIVLDSIPRDPVFVRMLARESEHQDILIRRAFLRSAIGHATRMEQLLAEVHGGSELRLGLPSIRDSISTEATVDGKKVAVRREANELVITLPRDATASHIVDLRVWLPMVASNSFEAVEPAIRMPVGVGRIYWEIASPQNDHVIWAAPTLGRSMAWRFDRWRLYRQPTQASETLASWVGASGLVPVPDGNRYLYVGSDALSFHVIFVSRVVLWMITASVVLFIAMLLTFIPVTRHPLTAVAGAIFFAGILVIAPDAAVLTGQLAIISLVLVVVMAAIRTMLDSRNSASALRSQPKAVDEASRPRAAEESDMRRGTLSKTRSIQQSSSVSKVSM